VAAEYASRGMHPGAVKQDQKDKGIWYFYLEQQEKAANGSPRSFQLMCWTAPREACIAESNQAFVP
jgi:hypothetical protein